MKLDLKTGALAAGLGLAAYFLAPLLLPVKVPADFPPLPDLSKQPEGLQTRLRDADREARRKPGSAPLVGKLAMVYHANMMFDQAQAAYRIAARLAPRDAQWTYAQAFLLEETGDADRQLKLLEATLQLQPAHVPAQFKLAELYFKLDRLDDAERLYAQAAQSSDQSARLPAGFGLGRIAARRRDWAKVVAAMEPLSASYNYVLGPYELLNEAYTALGDKAKAEQARRNFDDTKWKVIPPPDDPFSDQLTDDSFSSTRLLKQAGVLTRLGRPDRALAVARRAAQVDHVDPDIRNLLARTLLTFYGDKPEAVDEALNAITECLRMRPDDALPLWNFSNEFFRTPKPPAAVDRLAALLAQHRQAGESHYYLGMVADIKGDPREAEAQYQAAIQFNARDSAAFNKLGVIQMNTGRLNDALASLRRSVLLNDRNAAARLNLGVALLQRDDNAAALRELAEVIRLKPKDAPAYFLSGFALLSLKKPVDAAQFFRTGLALQPSDVQAHMGLATALRAQGQLEEAAAEARRAEQLQQQAAPRR